MGLVCFLLFYLFYYKWELDLFPHLQHLGLEEVLEKHLLLFIDVRVPL